MVDSVAGEGTSERLHHRLRVAEVITETADAVSLVFDLTAHQRERFAYRPGQFLTLRLPTPEGAVLCDLGLPRPNVRLERFTSLGGDPFANTVPAESDTTVDLAVEIGGARHRLAWPSNARLLDVLAANGLDAPTSCGEGVCASCECRVLEGEVRVVNNQVLEDEDIANGYALACQALPVTETVHVSF